MKNQILALTGLALAASIQPASAAEVKVLAPADRSLVRGTVTFRVQPVDAPTDMFFSNPEVSIQDEMGRPVEKLPAVKDPKTGICTAVFDSTKVRDGLYLVTVDYRTLYRGSFPMETREDLSIGVRNGGLRPTKFTVSLPERNYSPDEQADFEVKVYDQRGRLMPGARVSFKVDRGEVNDPADITDTAGEVFSSVSSEEAGTVTLTITVESLPPVTKTIRFAE